VCLSSAGRSVSALVEARPRIRTKGRIPAAHEALADPEVTLRHHSAEHAIELIAGNRDRSPCVIATAPNIYQSDSATAIELTPSSEPLAIS
jgi:hypothetical protein